MGTISVLKTPNMESNLHKARLGAGSGAPVSLLAFLQAENLRLKNAVAELQQDTRALREALQRN